MAEALYRKYRPQVFSSVVGQDHIERTIKNAIEQDKVSHAYLFCGPRGTGKTTTARLLAKALLCEQGPTSDPCGICAECEDIANGIHPDVYELDAASRTGVDNIRDEIISRVQFAPTRGSKKIYIIDEVHMLSTAAFNALLKTLEEPPAHVIFIMCTTDPQKVLETILSRCQRFDFKHITLEDIQHRLAEVCKFESVSYEDEALALIAQRSSGGMRNALTALEQAIAFGAGTVSVDSVEQFGGVQASSDVFALTDALVHNNTGECFAWVDTYAQKGGNFLTICETLAQHLRDMYVFSLVGEKGPVSCSESQKQQLLEQAKLMKKERLSYSLNVLGETMQQLRQATNPRLLFELALMKIARPETEASFEALQARIEVLEQTLASGAVVAAKPAISRDGLAKQNNQVPVKNSSPVKQPASTEQSANAVSSQVQISQKPAVQLSGKRLEGLQNPAYVQRVWKAASAKVKQSHPEYITHVMYAKPQYQPEEQVLYLQFSKGLPAVAKVASKPEVIESFEHALFEQVHVPVKIKISMQESGVTTRPQMPAANSSFADTKPQVASFAKEEQPVQKSADVIASAQETSTQKQEPVESVVQMAAKQAIQEPVHKEENDRVASEKVSEYKAPWEDGVESETAAPQESDYDYVPDDVYDAYVNDGFDVNEAYETYWDTLDLPGDEEPKTPEGAEEFSKLLQDSFGEALVIEEMQE